MLLGLLGPLGGLANIRGIQESGDAIRRQRAVFQPMLDPVFLHDQPLGAVLGHHRVVGAEPLNKPAIPGRPGIRDDDTVIRTFLCSAPR